MDAHTRLLIVNFHYIREEKPAAGIYPVTPEEFSRQLDILGKSYTFVSQQEVISGLTSGFRASNNCLITFDDGLAEQKTAIKILDEKGIPAIFYVPVSPYLSNETLAVHKLHYVRSVVPDAVLYDLLKSDEKILQITPAIAAVQYRYDNELAAIIKYYLNITLSHQESTEIIDRVFLQVVSDEHQFTNNLYFSAADLREIASRGMLGSHGTTHKPLSSLPDAEIKKEIETSLLFLEKVSNNKIVSFSYPFGSSAAVNENVAKHFDGTGVKFALTMFRGINTSVDLKSPYFLKRIDTNDARGGKKPLAEFYS